MQYVPFLADHHLTRRFDVYAGINHTQVSGGLASGDLNAANVASMAGARFSF